MLSKINARAGLNGILVMSLCLPLGAGGIALYAPKFLSVEPEVLVRLLVLFYFFCFSIVILGALKCQILIRTVGQNSNSFLGDVLSFWFAVVSALVVFSVSHF